MNKLNISSMEVLPEDITEAFTGVHTDSFLWGIECKATKQIVQVSDLVVAAQNLNVSVQTELDGDGKPVYPDRDRISLYHTAQSWKDKGLLNPGTDGYPSITGGGLYYDQKLWETAREISQIPGQLMPEMINKVWNEFKKKVDMTRYQPKGDHPFARLEGIQRMYIEAQNMIYVGRDGTKKRLLKE